MTAAQRKKLEAIRHRLVDVAIEETDPKGWIDEGKAQARAEELTIEGHAKDAAKLLSSWKGERYWEKKNANATIALILRVDELLADDEGAAKTGNDEKKQIKQAEEEAERRLRARTRPQLVGLQGGRQ